MLILIKFQLPLIGIVAFMEYDIGYFDEDSCRLEPIDNQLS